MKQTFYQDDVKVQLICVVQNTNLLYSATKKGFVCMNDLRAANSHHRPEFCLNQGACLFHMLQSTKEPHLLLASDSTGKVSFNFCYTMFSCHSKFAFLHFNCDSVRLTDSGWLYWEYLCLFVQIKLWDLRVRKSLQAYESAPQYLQLPFQLDSNEQFLYGGLFVRLFKVAQNTLEKVGIEQMCLL